MEIHLFCFSYFLLVYLISVVHGDGIEFSFICYLKAINKITAFYLAAVWHLLCCLTVRPLGGSRASHQAAIMTNCYMFLESLLSLYSSKINIHKDESIIIHTNKNSYQNTIFLCFRRAFKVFSCYLLPPSQFSQYLFGQLFTVPVDLPVSRHPPQQETMKICPGKGKHIPPLFFQGNIVHICSH